MIGQRKNTAADIVVVGFALFSMFFGAGTVIFPPCLGMEAGSQWLTGVSAYFFADVCHHSVHWAHGGHPPHQRQHL